MNTNLKKAILIFGGGFLVYWAFTKIMPFGGKSKSKKSKDTSWRSEYVTSLQVERSTRHHEKSIQQVCDAAPDATAKRGVMTNIHKESEETRNAILAKAKRVMPLYNKGGLQVLSESDDLKALNKVAR